MEIRAGGSVPSIFPTNAEAVFVDRAGRSFAAWRKGWFVSHGLSGRSVARRWLGHRREIRVLSPAEIRRLDAGGRQVLKAAAPKTGADLRAWMKRALAYDRAADVERYREVYRPVGILPPDQYGACVIQVTEGCGWNRCRFCSFYRGQPYRIKGQSQIREHMEAVAGYFGESLSNRRSIFLGEANALGASAELLAQTMDLAWKILVPKMTAFRGFFSFSEGSEASCHSSAEFRLLAGLGLKRVYYGVETGQEELRRHLGKPGTLRSIEESLENAKAAGVRVAVILLAGSGGHAWETPHLEESIRFIGRLPLDRSDIVFVSPLRGRDGTPGPALDARRLSDQMARLCRGLPQKARIAPYDIREFVY